MTRLTFLPSLGDARGRSATRRPPAAMAAGGEAVAGEGKKFKIRTRTTVHRDRTESPVPYWYRPIESNGGARSDLTVAIDHRKRLYRVLTAHVAGAEAAQIF